MRKLLITSAVVLLASGGAAIAANSSTPTSADQTTPLVQQVENHEQRIGDLETKTDGTQTQVNQNTADIGVIQGNTGSPSAARVETVQTPVTVYVPVQSSPSPETPQPEQPPVVIEPTPEPPKPKNYIYSVQDVPKTNVNYHECRYVIEERPGFINPVVSQPITMPCQQVGEILTGVN